MHALKMLGWVDLWIALGVAHILLTGAIIAKWIDHRRKVCSHCGKPFWRPVGRPQDGYCWKRAKDLSGGACYVGPDLTTPRKEEAK